MVVGVPLPPPLPPPSYSKVFPSSSKHIQSNSGQYPIFEKEGRIKRKKKKENPTPALRCPHTRRGRCEGGGRRGRGFHVPGHSHPVGGGLPDSTPSRHPAGRILTGRPAAGLRRGGSPGEERSRGERTQSWEHSACQPGHSEVPLGRGPESGWGPGPSGHAMGEGVWGPSCAAAVHLAGRDQAKTKQVPAPPSSAQTEIPRWKRVTPFSLQNRPFERNH